MSDTEIVENTLNNIEKLIRKTNMDMSLLKKRRLEETSKELSPLDVAKLNSSLGYVLNCLYKSTGF